MIDCPSLTVIGVQSIENNGLRVEQKMLNNTKIILKTNARIILSDRLFDQGSHGDQSFPPDRSQYDLTEFPIYQSNQ